MRGASYIEELPWGVDDRVLAWGLGPGESAVITEALRRPAAVAVLDDRAARDCAMLFRVPVIGAVGLLLKAKQVGLLTSVRPALDELQATGSFLHTKVRIAILQLAGEE